LSALAWPAAVMPWRAAVVDAIAWPVRWSGGRRVGVVVVVVYAVLADHDAVCSSRRDADRCPAAELSVNGSGCRHQPG